MKKLFALLSLFLLITPAFAQKPDTKTQEQITGYFSMVGSSFGCTKLVRSNFTDVNLAELHYIPSTQSANNWTNVLTIVIQTLPDDPTLIISAMNSYNSSMLNRYAKHTKLIETKNAKSVDGMPITYIEYVNGYGFNREHVVGVFGRHTDNMAAFVKYIARGKEVDEEARKAMKRLLATLEARK